MEKNILAIDLGKGSIGLAISRSGFFVSPLPEVRFKATHYEDALNAVKYVFQKEKVDRIVIGYPLFPSGDECEMTPIVKDFILVLEKEFPNIPIHPQDERNTTVEAAAIFHQNGLNSKKQRKKIDSGAAMVILERYLKGLGQL